MTTDVNSEVYDPDAPPESSGFITDFYGKLAASVMVSKDVLSNVDPRIADQVTKYWGDRTANPLWFLEAHGESVKRTDGQPFRVSDMVSLTSKDGKWLGKKQTPDFLATAYRGFGVSVSYLRVGQPDSAVGRSFHFKAFVKDAGKRWEKTISLYPVEIMPVGWTYTGEVTMIEPKSSDSDSSSGSSPASAPTVSQDEAINLLRQTLVGKPPSAMFDAILENSQLKAVGSIFGVSIMEAATDESLAKVLTENGVLTLNESGVFALPA